MTTLLLKCLIVFFIFAYINCDNDRNYLELAMIYDHTATQTLEEYGTTVLKHAKDSMVNINKILREKDQLNLTVVLNWLEIWNKKDVIDMSNGGHITRMSNYRGKMFDTKPWSDATLYITSVQHTVAGQFSSAMICTNKHAVGFVKLQNPRIAASEVAMYMVHELGHGLGAHHQNDNFGIMARVPDPTPNAVKEWDENAVNEITDFISSTSGDCLHNKPEYIAQNRLAMCGNGILEEGEDCDCIGDCEVKCCNMDTCMFKKDSYECAEGECCNTNKCRFRYRWYECRNDKCNKNIKCTGKSNECPVNYEIIDGECKEKPENMHSVAMKSVCGNAKIEGEEECDCGMSQCECCDSSCKYMKKGDSCNSDINDSRCKKCSGSSPYCNLKSEDFTPCYDDKGYCYEGSCKARDLQCHSLLQPQSGYEAVAALYSEYAKNSDSNEKKFLYHGGGFFSTEVGQNWKKSEPGDEQCGQILCDVQQDGVSYSRWTKRIDCFSKRLPKHDWCFKTIKDGGIGYLKYTESNGNERWSATLVEKGTPCVKHDVQGHCEHTVNEVNSFIYSTGVCVENDFFNFN